MRPRRLEIQGLRSYRQRQEIDFTGANLVAILGDTGAGKSSILEALCVALYTGSTWDKRSVKALISSGLPTLDVVLEFTADGKEWKVHRSFPAGNYPPATHLLIGITDGSQLNGAREVNERIVELVGLDYDAFLRAVLLPQGRFQALLQATGGERTSILKGIFRLDVLERVREVARTRSEELAARLADLQVQRAKLLDDPATAAALAEREHAEAAGEQQRLQAATAAVRAANQTGTELQRAAGLLDKGARTARDQDPAASLGEIARLEALAKEVEAKRAVQLALQAELDAEHGALAASLKKAEAAGLGYDALLGADRTLVELLEWIEKDAAARAQLGADEKQNGEKSKRLAALRTEVEALDRRLAEAKTEVEKNRVERDAARRGFDDAKRLLEGARATLRQRDKLQSSLAERESNFASCRQEVADATSKAKASASALKAAEKAAAEARRGHAAAHAAAGIESGDPCPVCDRKLPAGWKAPGAKDLKKAESALAAAAAAEQASQAQVTKLSARADELEGRLNEDRAALDSAEKELRVAVAALREIAGKGADPAATGDAPLEPLERKAAAAVKLLGEVERACGGHEKSLREREGELARMDAEVKASQTQVAATRGRLELDRKSADRKLAALPEPLRAASLETKLLEAARKRTTKEVEAAKASREREKDLGTSLRNVQAAVTALDEQRTREVTRPTSVIARRLDDLRRALEDLASEVEGDAPPKSDADAPSEVAAWARELGASREKLLRGVDARAKQIDSELAAARKTVTAALSEAGVESEAVLDARSTGVAVTLQRKAENLALARGQIALAAELDRRIAGGAPLVGALRELARLLTDGKFIGHVVDRKQQSLLVVASKLLGGMTKNRYGFSQEFDVVDRLTGEPRSVMTLSGGETFLASLALALGLVELAGREGGRLDALFLDEGFGSLDANALAEALEALEQQAAKGRMVAVISHLHAVAESIERVLRVERTPAGSRAQWLSESERAALLEQEATAGLLI